MAAKHSQLSLSPMEVQRVVSRGTTEGAPTGQGVVRAETSGLSLLVDAVAETCSDKDAYISLGLPDATYWSKVKRGEKPEPRIGRLTDLPEPTQKAMVAKWARQLKMHVTTEDEKRAALTELAECAVRALKVIA